MTCHRTTDPWVDEAMLIEIVMPSGARHPLTADPDSSLNRYGPEGRFSPALFDEGGDVFDALSLGLVLASRAAISRLNTRNGSKNG